MRVLVGKGLLDRLIVSVAAAGAASFLAILFAFGQPEWPLLPWLGFTAACAVMVSFPYRVDRPGESYFMDFDEILLLVSFLFLEPAPIVAFLSLGFFVGAVVRGISARRVLFNTGARALAASLAVVSVEILPVNGSQPESYIIGGLLAALIYSFTNQSLVSMALAILNRTSFTHEFRSSVTDVLARTWPIVVSYGLVVGVAGRHEPVALVLGAIPLLMVIGFSRITQKQRDEYLRMTGLYRAAQEMHEARTDEDILRILRYTVRKTLGVDGAKLRSTPPFGEELGAWLPNRNCWIIVPTPASADTRRQDDAFLQAAASLVESSMERATLVGELERQSLRDPLTNAYNRRYFHQVLSGALEQKGAKGCLALLDIDHFKVINDTYGHEVGDEALRTLVEIAEETFGTLGVLCRLGGDEFALILPNVSVSAAIEGLEGLRERLARSAPGDPGRRPEGFHASGGLAPYPECGRDPMSLLRSADRALYRAKREGRDRVVVVEETVEE
ncbi:MAG TPA: GGDEF domain-containing protein [Trueperaceae bacterium]